MNAPKWKPLEAVSPSQVAMFDDVTDPKTACQRKWALEKVFGRKPPDRIFHTEGKNLHQVVEDYYLQGIPIVDPVLLAGKPYWPDPGPQLLIEKWFTLPVPDWPDTRPVSTLNFADMKGYPVGQGRFVGRSDILDMSGNRPMVVDFKNVSSFSYVKKEHELASSVPMIAYGYWALTEMPSADSVVLKHVVHLKRPKKLDPKWKPRAKEIRTEVSREDIIRSWLQIVETVHTMRKLAVLQDWRDVPANRRACMAYGGCAHRDLCGYTASTDNDESFMIDDPGLPLEASPDGEQKMKDTQLKELIFQAYKQFQDGGVSPSMIHDLVSELSRGGWTLSVSGSDSFDAVFMHMAKYRRDLIDDLAENLALNQDPDPAQVAALRPLQIWYNALCQHTDPKIKGVCQTAQHPNEEDVIAWLKARKAQAAYRDKSKSVQPTTGQGNIMTLQIFLDATLNGPGVATMAKIVCGSIFMQSSKDHVAKMQGAAHYKAVDFGKGPGLVVSHARNQIMDMLKESNLILFLDSSDDVQRMLAHELASVADVYVQGVK